MADPERIDPQVPRRVPIQEIVKWSGVGGLVAGAIFGAVSLFLSADGHLPSRNIELAYLVMAAICAVAASIPAMLIGLAAGLCLRLVSRTPTTQRKPASETISDARTPAGIGCLCSALGSLAGFWGGFAHDCAVARRMAAEGLTVDFLPVEPIAGIFLGAIFGMLFGTVLAGTLRASQKQPPPDLLRSLAMSWAKDGNYREAIRCQTEALHCAPQEWQAQYRAEHESDRVEQSRQEPIRPRLPQSIGQDSPCTNRSVAGRLFCGAGVPPANLVVVWQSHLHNCCGAGVPPACAPEGPHLKDPQPGRLHHKKSDEETRKEQFRLDS